MTLSERAAIVRSSAVRDLLRLTEQPHVLSMAGGLPAPELQNTVITTGSQQALDLVARVLLNPGDVVVTEVPTYLGALSALHWLSPQIVGIEGDEHGLRTDILADRLAAGLRPKLVYLVTEFANPTGATLPLLAR